MRQPKENFLDHALAANRLSPNLLLLGSRSLRKKRALWLIRSLLCKNYSQDHVIADCRLCLSAQAGELSELVKLDADNGPVSVNKIREIRRDLAHTSFTGKPRFVWIEDLSLLSVNAANALLKTLEEPAEQQFFILGATELTSVLPTISSRCQHFYAGHEAEEVNEPSPILSTLLNRNNHDLRPLTNLVDDSWQNELIPCARNEIQLSLRGTTLEQRAATLKVEKLLKANKKLAHNANVKLTLEKLCLEGS